MRASELGISIGTLNRGSQNAITDVVGVRVGHTTLLDGSGPLVVGQGPARTGVTVIQPRAGPAWADPVFAVWHRLNGAGELTGLHWVRESGLLSARQTQHGFAAIGDGAGNSCRLQQLHVVVAVADRQYASRIQAPAPAE
jgi:L-aminopeptidase/D-esterase-like protein